MYKQYHTEHPRTIPDVPTVADGDEEVGQDGRAVSGARWGDGDGLEAVMGLKKIADLPDQCCHPEHKPPMHIVLPNGVYEHTCPACGTKCVFTVSNPQW